MVVALSCTQLFDGETFIGPRTVVIEDGLIAEVLPASAPVPVGVERVDLDGKLVAPGFVDVQVNGGGGVMFNSAPSVDTLKRMAAGHRRYGTTSLLPTLITDTPETMRAAADAVRSGIAREVPGIVGVHFEGPCLNPDRRGVHDPARMSRLTPELIDLYTGEGLGRVVVTLAPEMLAPGDVATLAGNGVLVCAGHTRASAAVMAGATDEGLRGVTHLFNAMPPLVGREPGVVGQALSDSRVFAGLIADNIHVAAASARAAILAKGPDRVMLVTDAMGTVGSDRKSFDLYGTEIFEIDGRCATADGTLAGSALNMIQAVRNVRDILGFPLTDALRMASLTPARFLGLDHRIGRITEGALANLVVIKPQGLTVERTYLHGSELEH